MADEEFLHPGLLGHGGSLEGGRMVALGALVLELLQIGGFVIKDRSALKPLRFLSKGGRIGAVRVAPGHKGLVGGFGGGNHAAIGPLHILSALEGTNFGEGEAVLFNGFLLHVERGFLLLEQEAEGLDAVVQRERLYADGLGFQDGLGLLHLERGKTDFVTDTVSVIAQEEFENGAEVDRCKDIQRRLASLHPQGGQQAEKAENVVSVDVGNEEGIQLHHRDSFLHHPVLDAFAAVYKEQAPVHLQCLGALVPAPYGHGRSRAQ